MVVKNGSRLCGTGAARASAPILQNKAYWEVKIQQGGDWSCGVCTPACDLNSSLGKDSTSWVLNSLGDVKHSGQSQSSIEQKIQEGDIIVSSLVLCHLSMKTSYLSKIVYRALRTTMLN